MIKAEQEVIASCKMIREGLEEGHSKGTGTLGSIQNSETQGHWKGREGQLKVAVSLPLLHPSTTLPQAVCNSSIREGKINIYQRKLKPKKGMGSVSRVAPKASRWWPVYSRTWGCSGDREWRK